MPSGVGELLEPTKDKAGRDAVMFRTGDGDGTYPTWIGHTAAGELACFVIDFMFLAHPWVTPEPF